ncbi:uncharacterized protein B0I36DRAFT_117746 [Microdochium trichocladiopsis]|uniref:Uncharacterized protein n=1 Tax=Microdochium trichocladiopsis TaxID=1682393 RepID=A0A9P9BQK9_9PEZI|nr:uncharacterized protein B0I36DRAFT_117746 [Microdochium trichocladiopsis]KAH7031022.1 hypothetical protein B0I36DRAFT_117746 [Microdochium trichocladiopsis]
MSKPSTRKGETLSAIFAIGVSVETTIYGGILVEPIARPNAQTTVLVVVHLWGLLHIAADPLHLEGVPKRRWRVKCAESQAWLMAWYFMVKRRKTHGIRRTQDSLVIPEGCCNWERRPTNSWSVAKPCDLLMRARFGLEHFSTWMKGNHATGGGNCVQAAERRLRAWVVEMLIVGAENMFQLSLLQLPFIHENVLVESS